MLPHAPATYALVMRATRSNRLQIGKLGELQVQPGFYTYVGSAFGPGGLRGRLSHHLKSLAAPHWHIDYLRQAAEVVEVWAVEGPEKHEHEWSRALGRCPECLLPLPRFGASDCRCPAHLFFLPARPTLEWFKNRVGLFLENDPPVSSPGWLHKIAGAWPNLPDDRGSQSPQKLARSISIREEGAR